MALTDIGNKAASGKFNCQNLDTVTIPQGSPVCLIINGTSDGFGVCLPSTGAAAKATSLFFGIVDRNMNVNDYGLAAVFGYVAKGVFSQQSRPTSTDTYNSATSLAIGDLLLVDTVNNAVTRAAAGAASAFAGFCVAAQTLASAASSASTSTDASVCKTYALKMFLRAM